MRKRGSNVTPIHPPGAGGLSSAGSGSGNGSGCSSRLSFHVPSERAANVVGSRLAEARRRKGWSLVQLSQRLEDFGISISGAGISKWEVGRTTPDAYQLMALCTALDIDGLPQALLSGYQPLLNDAGLCKLEEYREDLIASGRYRPQPAQTQEIRWVDMPVCLLSASAGTGNFLDGDSMEMKSFPASSVPAGAEFAIRVKGDSMEPRYQDGQYVWIQRCGKLQVGEIGLFSYDGEGYIKAYGEQTPEADVQEEYTDSNGAVYAQPVLTSLNPAYPPRPVSPYATFQIVGRVL